MNLSEEDIKRIANEVYELQKRDKQFTVKKPVYSKEWIKLSKEIDAWCHENKDGYGAIRFVTGCSWIKSLTKYDIPPARFIFEQMTSEFKKNRGK